MIKDIVLGFLTIFILGLSIGIGLSTGILIGKMIGV